MKPNQFLQAVDVLLWAVSSDSEERQDVTSSHFTHSSIDVMERITERIYTAVIMSPSQPITSLHPAERWPGKTLDFIAALHYLVVSVVFDRLLHTAR